jgi:hypothetical protein
MAETVDFVPVFAVEIESAACRTRRITHKARSRSHQESDQPTRTPNTSSPSREPDRDGPFDVTPPLYRSTEDD